MRFILKVFAIIYRSFDDRGLDIPYFRSLLIVVLLFIIHIFSIGLLLNIPLNFIIPWNPQGGVWKRWLIESIAFGAVVLTAILIFSKKKVDRIVVTEGEIQKGRKILPLYISFSFAVLFVLLVVHGIKMGKIHF